MIRKDMLSSNIFSYHCGYQLQIIYFHIFLYLVFIHTITANPIV